MAESLFDIFGDHITRQAVKNVSRQPLHAIENQGKAILSGPVKPIEPVKKVGETKKSFFKNTGKTLQSTPIRQVFSPKSFNVASLIYTDDDDKSDKKLINDDLKFTKPTYKYDNYNRDIFDYLTLPEPHPVRHVSPPNTPPPKEREFSLELNCSYQDDIFKDDLLCGTIPDIDDLGLPELY